MKKAKLTDSEYLVKTGKILRTKQMTAQEKYFEIALAGGESLDHEPGQFVMVSVPGVGEAPISVSSSPTKRGSFELVVRKAGKLTGVLHNLEASDTVGIRGPFGKGFPTQILEGNDLIFVAGGLGIVPLRSLINFVIDNRRDFGKVDILLGCKTPQDMLFGDEVEEWSKRLDVNFSCTVDRADPEWKGNVGLITSLIPGVTLDPEQPRVVVLHRLINHNAGAVEAAPWAVTVCQGPGRAIIPQEPYIAHEAKLLPGRTMTLWNYTDMHDPRYTWGTKYVQVRCDPANNVAQKIGFQNTPGWAAFYRDGELFVKRFVFDPKATYPDLGSNIEAYTGSDMLELETLGALVRIPPAGKAEHTETWSLNKVTLGEDDAALGNALPALVK